MKKLAHSIFHRCAVVNACPICAQCSSMPPAKVPLPWPETGEKWSRVHINYARPINGQMLQIVVDPHTKSTEVSHMKIASVGRTSEALQ